MEKKLKDERDAKIAAAQEKMRAIEEQMKKMEAATAEQEVLARESQGEITAVVEDAKKLHEAYLVKKRTLDLLPNAAENYRKLSGLVDASTERIMGFGQQWEAARIPLINKYRRRKQLLGERKTEVGRKVEQIKLMRDELRRKAADLKEKARLHEQVVQELAALPKAVPREAYVKRIMDVVKNLVKYRQEIERILESVRKVQKDINAASQTQGRSFALADDTIYTAARREKNTNVPPEQRFASQSYGNIVKIRDGFAALTKQVESTGHIKNDILALQSKIEALESKNITANMKTVMTDLNQVKQENEQLIEQAKKLKSVARKLTA